MQWIIAYIWELQGNLKEHNELNDLVNQLDSIKKQFSTRGDFNIKNE